MLRLMLMLRLNLDSYCCTYLNKRFYRGSKNLSHYIFGMVETKTTWVNHAWVANRYQWYFETPLRSFETIWFLENISIFVVHYRWINEYNNGCCDYMGNKTPYYNCHCLTHLTGDTRSQPIINSIITTTITSISSVACSPEDTPCHLL